MSDKASLESLEMLLAAACNLLNQAAGEQKELEFEPVRENLKLIGSTLVNTWEVRERIHRERPDLKNAFIVAREENPAAYEEFNKAFGETTKHEQEGSFEMAISTYDRIARKTPIPCFKRIAEFLSHRVQHIFPGDLTRD
jgi:hypothetical protein